ncbi:hypothetical protein [Pontibacter oryzae]|uniref:Lipoprotein n=1 Tax=Pontibacter oryzae TaxID=2304593 RepID=A0A399SGC9_9BACT|nr:hypothetical protein [Pontibacter oryzae]RIJ42640.1 hypothetical protein D1627_01940 [Pontibacter oryzae]
MNKVKLLALVSALLALISCSKHASVKVDTNEAAALKEDDKVQENQSNIIIDDSTQLSPNFLSELRNSGYPERIRFVDEYVLVGNDTVYFPSDLKLGKRYEFLATTEGKKYNLSVERINSSTIHFDFILYENSKVLQKQSGQADLGPYFFLATEVDEDNITGEAYGSSEYKTTTEDCWFNIRIGIGKDDKGRLRATIVNGCEKESDTDLVNGNITLRTEKSTN